MSRILYRKVYTYTAQNNLIVLNFSYIKYFAVGRLHQKSPE